MRKREIKEQATKVHSAMKRSLRSFIKKGDQEMLHRFRTGVKKLRALATLVEQTAPATHLRNQLKPIRSTYQLSGKVRDSYLHAELGRKVGAAEEYVVKQQKLMEKASAKLSADRAAHYKNLTRAKEDLLKHLCDIPVINLTLFYEHELHAIGKELMEQRTDEQLHDSRKRLKVLLYNLPLVRHVLTLSINEDYLDQVQNAMGDWHDNLLASEHFPDLAQKTSSMRKTVDDLTRDFYERATTPVEMPLTQMD